MYQHSTSLFIKAEELAVLTDTFRLVDARAPRMYVQGHLPGAVSLDARALNSAAGRGRQLVDAQSLAEQWRRLGLGAEPTVVYGARGGADAAHVWWTLQAYGHPAAYLLDGGIEAWQNAGLPVTTESPQPYEVEAPFEPELSQESLITLEELKERLGDPNLSILDTRSLGEYRGQDVFAARAGHIPGAALLPWDDLIEPEALTLKSEPALRTKLEILRDAPEVALYCQSGVRAAHTFAVLMHLGIARPRLYLGSWEEWGNRHDTPVATPLEDSEAYNKYEKEAGK